MAKAKPSAKAWIFSRSVVISRDLQAVLSENPEAVEKGNEHTVLYIRKQGNWGHHAFNWGSVALTAALKPSFEVVVVGTQGEVLQGVKGAFHDESVDDSDEGPENVGHLRDARFIGGKVFAVGALRQAYRRNRPGDWARVDKGLRQGGVKDPDDLRGLECVDGFSGKDVYAAGLDGEIWHYDGKTWVQLDSPTNVVLHRLRCVAPDRVYICGAAGVLLQGRKKKFEVVAQDVTKDDFQGIEWFAGRLYVASAGALYTWDGQNFEKADLELGSGFTFGDLDANDGLMWSTGARHLAETTDGKTWTQLFL